MTRLRDAGTGWKNRELQVGAPGGALVAGIGGSVENRDFWTGRCDSPGDMWLRSLSWYSVALLAAASLRADLPDAARQAQAMIGHDRWSRVLRIESVRPGSARPVVVHALVFELEDRLWYYAAGSGTESLSLYRGRLAQDKADLGPLLHEVVPSMVRFDVLEPAPAAPAAGLPRGGLPNGCFIESVAYWQRLVDTGQGPDEARLVSYYGPPAGNVPGHTVLYFARGEQRYYYDAHGSAVPRPIPGRVPAGALAIAQYAAPGPGHAPPVRAVFLPLRSPLPPDPRWKGRAMAANKPAAGGPAVPAGLN